MNVNRIKKSKKNRNRKKQRLAIRKPFRPMIERLEERQLLATFAEAGDLLDLQLAAGEHVELIAESDHYALTLTGGTWSGTDSANVSGDGGAVLTVPAAGREVFDTINVGDAGPDASVTIGGSNGSTYSESINVDLNDPAAGEIRFAGASSFTGSAGLFASTTRNVVLPQNTSVTTVDGDVSLIANPNGTTDGRFIGVHLLRATIETTGSGNVLLSGHGGNDADTSDHYGVRLQEGGAVRSTSAAADAGTITIVGTGGAGVHVNHGVYITDEGVSSVTGDITVIGQGGQGTGAGNLGVWLNRGATISSTGVDADAANITIDATSGPNADGLRIGQHTGGNVSAIAGDIGISGRSVSGNNDGVQFFGSAAVVSSGSSDIQITGTSAAGRGLRSFNVSNVIGGPLATGNIAITADVVDFSSGLTAQSTGELRIVPATASTSIGIGGGSGTLNIDDTELAALADGFSGITIGDPVNGTGNVDVDTASFLDPVTVAGGTFHDHDGTDISAPSVTLNGDVAPGQSPGILSLDGDFTLADGSTFAVEIGGATAGMGTGFHDQIDVTGTFEIGAGVSLNVTTASFTPAVGDEFVIVNNDGSDAVIGTFDGLAEGTIITASGGFTGAISYVGGDGNDVVLTTTSRTLTWVGDIDTNWNTDNGGDTNWENDLLPVDGDVLVFPAFDGTRTTTNDTTDGNSYALVVGVGNTLNGNSITLDVAGTDITQPVRPTGISGSEPRVNNDLTLASDTEFDVSQQLWLRGILSGTSGGFAKTGTGHLVVFEPNTFDGSVTVTEGTVRTTDGGGLGATSAGTVLQEGATFALQTTDAVNEPITIDEPATIQVGVFVPTAELAGMVTANAATTFTTSARGTVSGQITGSGPIELRGGNESKPLVIAGTSNDYTGDTTVTGNGFVLINGSLPTVSDVTVSRTATLGGTGNVAGSLTVDGTLSPGDFGIGVLNTGSLALGSDAQIDIDLQDPFTTAGTDYDQVDVTGTVNIAGAFLNLIGGSSASGSAAELTIINNDGDDDVVGAFAGLAEGATFRQDGTLYQISYSGGDGNDVVIRAVPDLTADFYTVVADEVLVVADPGVLANDTGDGLSVASFDATSREGGVISNTSASGGFTYTPPASFVSLGQLDVELDLFKYSATDSSGATGTSTAYVVVRGVNDSPLAAADTLGLDEIIETTVAAPGILQNDTDPDTSDELSAVAGVMVGSAGGRLNLSADGGYVYTPSADTVNNTPPDTVVQDVFSYSIVDPFGGIASSTLTVEFTIPFPPEQINAADDRYETLAGVDINEPPPSLLINDTGEDIEITAFDATSALSRDVTADVDGRFTYDTSPDLQSLADGETLVDSFTYTITDAVGDERSAEVSIVINGVNDAPDAVGDVFDVATREPLTIDAPGILENDIELDNGDSITIESFDAESELGAAVVVNADGSFTYTHTAHSLTLLDPGATVFDRFEYTIRDESGATDTTTATIRIDVPHAVDILLAAEEDQVLEEGEPGLLAFRQQYPDLPDLTVSDSPTASDQGAALAITADGSFSYDPRGVAEFDALALGEIGEDRFVFTVEDDQNNTTEITVYVLVRGAADGGEDSFTATANEVLEIDAPGVLDNDAPNTTVVSADATSVRGATVAFNADGSFSYDPTTSAELSFLSLGQQVFDSFEYMAQTDSDDPVPVKVTVTVAGVNHSPYAAPDELEATSIATLSLPSPGVLATDIDIDVNGEIEYGTDIRVVEFDAVSRLGAAVSISADGALSYDPRTSDELLMLEPGIPADDQFDYTIEDEHGLTATSTVFIRVTGDALPPVAVADVLVIGAGAATTPEAFAAALAEHNLLDNDTGGWGERRVVRFDSVSDKGAAVHVSHTGRLAYNAATSSVLSSLKSGESAADSFSYTISDSLGNKSMAEVAIQFLGANQGSDDDFSAGTLNVLSVPAPGVLANDPPVGDGPHEVTSFDDRSLQGAVVNVAADGSFTYDPTGVTAFETIRPGTRLFDAFTYTTGPDGPDQKTHTVTITLTATNRQPTIDLGTDMITLGRRGHLFVSATGADVDSETLTGTATFGDGLPPVDVMISNGRFNLQHAYETAGTYIVAVTLNDSDGGEVTDTLRVTVPRLDATAGHAAHLFHALYGRDPGRLEFNDALLDRRNLVKRLVASSEYQSVRVTAVYQALLDRTPSDEEVFDQIDLYAETDITASVTRDLAISAAYTDAHPTSTDFVNGIFNDLIGRDPTDEERDPLVAQLDGGATHRDIMEAFLLDTPYLTAKVTELYQHFLGRDPAASYLNAAVSRLQARTQTLDSLTVTLLSSGEFKSRVRGPDATSNSLAATRALTAPRSVAAAPTESGVTIEMSGSVVTITLPADTDDLDYAAFQLTTNEMTNEFVLITGVGYPMLDQAEPATKFFRDTFDATGATAIDIFGSTGDDHIQINTGKVDSGVTQEVDEGTVAVDAVMTVYGQQGDDVLEVLGGRSLNREATGSVWLDGGSGNDRLLGGHFQDDTLVGGAGDDYLDGLGGDDVQNGGAGHDTLVGGGRPDPTEIETDADFLITGEADRTANTVILDPGYSAQTRIVHGLSPDPLLESFENALPDPPAAAASLAGAAPLASLSPLNDPPLSLDGVKITSFGGGSPSSEQVANAIDGDVNTDYTNLGGEGSGFIMEFEDLVFVRDIELVASNDLIEERWPVWIYLEGSTDGTNFNFMYSATFEPATTDGEVQRKIFVSPPPSPPAYSYFRFTFIELRGEILGIHDAFAEFAEIRLFGVKETSPVIDLSGATARGFDDNDNRSPRNEEPAKAIDGKTSTKYLNFGEINSGLEIDLNGKVAQLDGFTIVSANDASERDPTLAKLEGWTGSKYEQFWSGSIPDFTERFQSQHVTFPISRKYSKFRFTVTGVRNSGAASSMQFAELKLRGSLFTPPPPALDGLQRDLTAEELKSAARPEFAGPGVIPNGGRLSSGQSIYSKNGRMLLTMQPDGNLVLSVEPEGTTVWSSRTGSYYAGGFAEVSVGDGKLRIVRPRDGQSKEFGGYSNQSFSGTKLEIRNDGNLALVDDVGKEVWNSSSAGDAREIVEQAALNVRLDGNTLSITGRNGYGFQIVAGPGTGWNTRTRYVSGFGYSEQFYTYGGTFMLKSVMGDIPVALPWLTIDTKDDDIRNFGAVRDDHIEVVGMNLGFDTNDHESIQAELDRVGMAFNTSGGVQFGIGTGQYIKENSSLLPDAPISDQIPFIYFKAGVTAPVIEQNGVELELGSSNFAGMLFDPADPFFYVESENGFTPVGRVAAGYSHRGHIPFEAKQRLDERTGDVFGNVYLNGEVSIGIKVADLTLNGELVIDLDANNDGVFADNLVSLDSLFTAAGHDPLASSLKHRYSFNGDTNDRIADSVGDEFGIIINQSGSGQSSGGGGHHQGSNELRLYGGDHGTSDFIALSSRVLDGLTDATFEFWVTQKSTQHWSRIFSFGPDFKNFLMASWTRGTDLNSDRVQWRHDSNQAILDDAMKPYHLNREYHLAFVVDEGGGSGGKTKVSVYKDGVLEGSFETDHKLSKLDGGIFLGQSKFSADKTADASYNEFRIYDRALTAAQIKRNTTRGPDAEVSSDPTRFHDDISIAGNGDAKLEFAEDPLTLAIPIAEASFVYQGQFAPGNTRRFAVAGATVDPFADTVLDDFAGPTTDVEVSAYFDDRDRYTVRVSGDHRIAPLTSVGGDIILRDTGITAALRARNPIPNFPDIQVSGTIQYDGDHRFFASVGKRYDFGPFSAYASLHTRFGNLNTSLEPIPYFASVGMKAGGDISVGFCSVRAEVGGTLTWRDGSGFSGEGWVEGYACYLGGRYGGRFDTGGFHVNLPYPVPDVRVNFT